MNRRYRIKSIKTKKVDPLDLDCLTADETIDYLARGEEVPIAIFEIDLGKLILEAASGKEFEIDEEELN